MSDLYARLKALSARPKEAPKAEEKPCAVRQRVFRMEPAFALEPERLAELFSLEGVALDGLDRLLFLDTETTGLSHGAGTVAFLVGVGWLEDGLFVCRQYWMRDYDEEEDLIRRLEAHFDKRPVLVTFNGKSFDVPLLQSRFVMQQKRMAALPQVDLLSHARRIFKLRLNRVNLTALEEALLGQQRPDDLPGALVPQRYFDYLKTGDVSLLEPVFEHNAQDVYSLSKLLKILAEAYRSPESLRYAQDLYGVGRTYERAGQEARAEHYYVLASRECGDAALALGRIYKRRGHLSDALPALTQAAQHSAAANVELAKYYEHQLRDPSTALAYTDRAIVMESRPKPLLALFHRRARLIRQMEKKE